MFTVAWTQAREITELERGQLGLFSPVACVLSDTLAALLSRNSGDRIGMKTLLGLVA